MAKYKKSQVLILSLIAVLLSATPFLSASIRSAYHYFIVNILIVALGAEAGLLSSFSSSLKPAPAANKIVSVSSSSDHSEGMISVSSKGTAARHGLKTNSENDGCSTMNDRMQKLASVSASAPPGRYYPKKSACLQEGSTITTTTGHGLETNLSQKNSGRKANGVMKKFATRKICINGTSIKTCQAIEKQNHSSPSIFFIGCEENSSEPVKAIYEEGLREEKLVGGISGQELYAKAEAFIENFYEQLKMQRQES